MASLLEMRPRWERGSWICAILAFILGVLLLLRRSKQERHYHRAIQSAGLHYSGRDLPSNLPTLALSFWNSSDLISRTFAGAFRGVETIVFESRGFRGDMSYEQTTVAFRSQAQITHTNLLNSAGLKAERVGQWLILFRPNKLIRGSDIAGFVADCWSLVQYSEDLLKMRNPNTSG